MRSFALVIFSASWLVAGCDSGSVLPASVETNPTSDIPATTSATNQTQPDHTQVANVDEEDEEGALQPSSPNPVEPGQPRQPADVSFSKDVMPILAANCNQAKCHGDVRPAKGITLTTYAGVMRQVLAGSSTNSNLYRQISGPRPKMPPGKPLSSADVATIKQWIDGGAPNN